MKMNTKGKNAIKVLFLLFSLYLFNINILPSVEANSEEKEIRTQDKNKGTEYGTYEVQPLGDSNKRYQIEKRNMPHSELQQTGIFVKAGEVLEVTVNNENSNLSISIGQYGAYSVLNDGEAVNFITMDLHQGKNEITSEIEGMVYLKNKSDSMESLVEVKGGQKVPFFIVNSTSKEEWIEMIQTMQSAPFVELKGENMIGTFQLAANKETLAQINVNELLKYWDEVVALSDETYGFKRGTEGNFDKSNHPVHIVNPDSGAGWASATHYRITFQVDTGAGKSALTGGREDENWGLWHEIGHTYQTPAYKWYEMGEATVNISSAYVMRHYGLEE